MRVPLTHPDISRLKYQIREIVDVANVVKTLDPSRPIVWENIGDPIAKGWTVPPFLKTLLTEEIAKFGDAAFGYAHSRGQLATRTWVAETAKKFAPSVTLTPDDVVFTNGLGSAIAALYHMLPRGARVLQPSPGYPTHASLEAFAAGNNPITYKLDPQHNWLPDVADMEAQIVAHPDIAGIVIINPNNPTGAVYSREVLERIVALAEKYSLFLISDEVYFRLTYHSQTYTQLSELAHGRAPVIVMRGMSKDVPWPGARCGWLECHNSTNDEEFGRYATAIKQRILMEVCATTLPQVILPRVYDHPEYPAWLAQYVTELETTATDIVSILSQTKGITVIAPQGAFYLTVVFDPGVLHEKQTLAIPHDGVRSHIEKVAVDGIPLDRRFAYYLLGATGICVVPASGFNFPQYGFRVTTLDRDPVRRRDTYTRLGQAIGQYLAS